VSEPLLPAEAKVRSLRAGEDHLRWRWRSGGGRWLIHLDPLVSHELPTGASVCSPTPILRSRNGAQPTRKGCSRTLTWRGLAVALPCH
jgi:hypothetical protein